MARILIAGCGYVGSALGARLVADSHEVWGLRRRPAALPEGVQFLGADLAVAASLRELPGELDQIVYAAGPGGRDDAHYRTAYVEGLTRLLEALEQQSQRPGRVLFVSSTSVYAQTGGAWVDEESETKPSAHNGRRLLEAETILHAAPWPGTVVRFGGIYGPRRTRLLERVRTGQAVYRSGTPRYTNRIHRDDCAGVLHHLLDHPAPDPLYLAVDDDPAEEREVMRWLADALGAPGPRPAMDPPARSRGGAGNKRCRNARLRESGYTFAYPSYREGYAQLVRELS